MKNIFGIILSLMILAIVSVSCTTKVETYTVSEIDGIKTYHNKNIPADPNFKIEPREIFSIVSEDENNPDSMRTLQMILDCSTDSKDNIYLLDSRSCSVKKFDRNGKYVKSFGRSGNGPGEFVNTGNMAILNDTIIVSDETNRRWVRFNPDGDFITFAPMGTDAIHFMSSTSNNKFIGFKYSGKVEDGGFYMSFNLNLMDHNFNDIANFNNYETKYDPGAYPFFDMYFPFAHSVAGNSIYIPENSENEYKIKVYDFEGNMKYIIKNNYIKKKFDENELDDFNAWAKVFGISSVDAQYKKAINDLYVDKYNRLWVNSSFKRTAENKYDFIVDVYENGVFLNKITIDLCKAYSVFLPDVQVSFNGGRIYVLDSTESTVRVFEY